MIPDKEGWWIGSWCGLIPRPEYVNAKLCASSDPGYSGTPVTNPRWTWFFQIPSPAQHAATMEALKAADELSKSVNGIPQHYGPDDKYQAARAKLAALEKEST